MIRNLNFCEKDKEMQKIIKDIKLIKNKSLKDYNLIKLKIKQAKKKSSF